MDNCPKCNGKLWTPIEDSKMCAVCGYVWYKYPVLPYGKNATKFNRRGEWAKKI